MASNELVDNSKCLAPRSPYLASPKRLCESEEGGLKR
jgi:hypothetical protein